MGFKTYDEKDIRRAGEKERTREGVKERGR